MSRAKRSFESSRRRADSISVQSLNSSSCAIPTAIKDLPTYSPSFSHSSPLRPRRLWHDISVDHPVPDHSAIFLPHPVAPHVDGFLHSRHLQLAHVPRRLGPDLAHASSPAFLAQALLVGGEIEGYEEEEVGGEDANTGERGEFLAGAFAGGGEVGKVGR